MNLKKSSSSRPSSVLISRALKTVGIIAVLAALLDMIILPIPYQIMERQWQINFATQMVDRGIVPLVGIVLFITGFWVDQVGGTASERKQTWQDPRFWAFVLSSILGLFFLLLFPLHLNNVRLGNTDAVSQLSQQATEAENQLNTRLQTEVQSQRQQITQLLEASDEQLTQLTSAGQLSKEQADLIRNFKKDPNSLDSFLKQRQEELRNRLQTELGTRREQEQKNIKTEALKSGLRVGISSLLLAIGFIFVGWVGLRNLSQL